jgi:hypothetical protein
MTQSVNGRRRWYNTPPIAILVAMTNWCGAATCPNRLFECSQSEPICPTGCFAIWLSSPSAKNISLHRWVEAVLLIPPSTPHKGRIAIVTDAGLDAMDAAATQDERR